MVKVLIARGVDDPGFVRLFDVSFPPEEKIPLANLRRTLGRGGVLRLFYDADRFVGFAYTFEYEGIMFLVYLATEPDLRGLGYGSDILDYLASEKKGRKMFLVVEKETGTGEERKLRHRRQEFYKRNGWKDTGCELLSDGYYFNSMYLDEQIPEQDLINTIRVYEDIHTGRY